MAFDRDNRRTYSAFTQHPSNFGLEIVEQLDRIDISIRPTRIALGAVPMIVRDRDRRALEPPGAGGNAMGIGVVSRLSR